MIPTLKRPTYLVDGSNARQLNYWNQPPLCPAPTVTLVYSLLMHQNLCADIPKFLELILVEKLSFNDTILLIDGFYIYNAWSWGSAPFGRPSPCALVGRTPHDYYASIL